MTRQERVALHKKQERLQIKKGVPAITELTEGVPIVRDTAEGLVEYHRKGSVLYKNVLEKV